MANLLEKYIGGFTAIALTFGSFIACGTQMYKVSVADDFDNQRATAAHPPSADKTSTLYGIHAPHGWQDLPVPFRFSTEMNEGQKIHLMAAMKKWEWAIGRRIFDFTGEHAGTNGDSFQDLYSSLQDDINGYYLDDHWGKTKKSDHVLATTIWNNGVDYSIIKKSDIRFNNEYYLFGDSLELRSTPARVVVDMQSLALHELGHLLGLAHIDESVDSLSIMNPELLIGEGLTTRMLSRGDLERIQMIYGCEGKSCDIEAMIKEQESVDWDKLTLTAKRWMQTPGESPTLELH